MASTYFDDQWLGMKAYKEWLLCGDDRTSAKCKVCPIPRNKIELSSMCERAIKSHAKGKKHCERLALYTQSTRIAFAPLPKRSTESPGSSSTYICSSTFCRHILLKWNTAHFAQIDETLLN